jgi:hypothetical protein
MKLPIFLLLVFGLVLAGSGAAVACPNCYNGATSPASAGMNWAILAMLGITGMVMSMILGAAFFFWRRAKRQRAALSERLFVNEEGQLHFTNVKGIPEWNKF